MLFVLVAIALMGTMPAFSQTQGGVDQTAGIPRISCSVTSSHDSLYFRGNDYVPNRIRLTITVTNISTGPDTARDIVANMVADTRFVIEGLPVRPIVALLLPGESKSITFDLLVASERTVDGFDTVRTLITSTNGAFAECARPIWVEHEYTPNFDLLCSRMFGQIVFQDDINDYSPNPFKIKIDLTNAGDGGSDSTLVQYLGTRGISVDPNASSIQELGTVGPGQSRSVEFSLLAIKRINDTTVTACVQVQGKGGYKRKTYIDSCCIDIFVPLAKQAVYDVQCDIVPDSIEFKDHRYTPDPFEYRVNIRNIGTANGKNVRAQIILPPSLVLQSSETIVKDLGDMNVNATGFVSWFLRPTTLFKRDTVKVCVRVFDEFENSSTCCDSVVVDSVRSANFSVVCSGPDSLKVDPVLGTYVPEIFTVRFHVSNVGSDYADSVKATIIIQNPDVVGAEIPFLSTKEKIVLSGSDTLGVDNSFEFTWDLRSLRRAVSGPVTIKFTVEAANAITRECEITIFIPQLDAPDIALGCEISPPMLDVGLNGYIPSEFVYRLKITNPGGSAADSVRATLVLPPGLALKTGQTLERYVIDQLAPGDTASVVWILIPLPRRSDSAVVCISGVVTAVNVDGRFSLSSECCISIPLLPYTAALVIPRDPIGYYGGPNVEVPIYIDDPSEKKISSFDFELLYNVDADGTPLSKNIVALSGVAACLTNRPEQERQLTCNWDINAVAVSDNLLRVTARARGNDVLAYPSLGAGQPAPPLMVLLFNPVFGAAPDQMSYAMSSLLWPIGPDAQKQRVLINNGAIRGILSDGMVTISGDCLRPLVASNKYVISQNKPNPFNPATVIDYSVPEKSHVRITVHDHLGRQVAVLVDNEVDTGWHSVTFNASGLPSGVYFYRMESTNFSQVLKMVVAK